MIHDEFDALPQEVRDGLARAAEKRASQGKLRVQMGQEWYPIRDVDSAGFEVALAAAPKLRGLVEIHDGARMLRSALIVAGAPDGDAIRYEFKRSTPMRLTAPVDYVRATEEPAGYLPSA